MNDNNNESKELITISSESAENELDNLPVAESKEDKLVRNLFLYETTYEAAIKAGYTENTAKSTIYTKIKKERFRNKIRDYAVANDLLEIPIIAHIERKILKAVNKNIKDYPKYKDVFKQKKKVAGILADDTAPVQQMITIQACEKVQINLKAACEYQLKELTGTDIE